MSANSAGRAETGALGVGVTYMPALEPLFERHADLIDVVEIEPQTLWREHEGAKPRYRAAEGAFERVAALPFAKLIHSVGSPVGGTIHATPDQLALLAENVATVGSPWVSDHLSFNATPQFHTGFFLPPRQTAEGVENAVAATRELGRACGVPVAIETGVNYLRPRADEMLDGVFVAEIARKADCGILLDLHNLYCNQLNGRQTVDEFLGQIPLERVWEVHLAGGLEMDGYWLDAHSGAIPLALVEQCRRIFPALPNLKAVIFEIFPSFVEQVGIDTVRVQIETLHDLWQLRGRPGGDRRGPSNKTAANEALTVSPLSAARWEEALGSLVIGRGCETAAARELAPDPAINVVRGLIHEFRGSMVVGVLRLTSRLLMLALGPEAFMLLLRDFWSLNPPRQYASAESEAFAEYLVQLDLKVPHLGKVLEFERAVVSSLMNRETRVVSFDFDPLPLLRALAEGHLPEIAGVAGRFEIELTQGGPTSANGLHVDSVQRAFPFH